MKPAIILAALLWLTPQMVADKCVSEASFAVRECACTVYNRLHAKPRPWSEYKVLDAYYAVSGHASAEQVQAVADVLSGAAACGPEYFIYSKEDVAYLGYGHYEPVAVVTDGDRAVMLFSRWFRREQ